ncbi:MAG TPA: SH3 domain-containing protein, partial [Chloroflexota bacterium]
MSLQQPTRAALAVSIFSAALLLPLLSPLAVHADRFGPPFMDKVTAESTTLYADPDKRQPVGPIAREAIVVVLGQQGDMIQVPGGWVPASDVSETVEPWVAEVSDPSTPVYAYPDAHSSVRRTAQQGDLLRVSGVAHGVADDNNLWWATTEGFVGLHSLRASTSEWASRWSMPSADLARGGWWGQASPANVRAGPAPEAPLLGELGGGEFVKVLGEESGAEVEGSSTWYRIDGGRFAGGYVHASLVQRASEPRPTVAPPPP